MFEKLKKVVRPANPEYKFSIVIPTWNNLSYLQLCIRSIQTNSYFKHQIIVLINEGNDGTLQWLEEQSDIDYIHSPDNIGICYGLNICRPLITTQHLLYLNDDMYVLPDWDLHLWNEIDAIGHKNFMLSSTMIEPYDTGNKCVIVDNYGDNLENFNEQELLTNYNKNDKKNWNGSTWPPNIIHVDTWDLVGGMSTEFSPGMYSDPDFTMKLWKADIRLLKGIGSSRVYHFGSKSTSRIRKNKGKKTFIRKWGITPRLFTDKFIKRGEVYNGELLNYNLSNMERIVSWFKNIF